MRALSRHILENIGYGGFHLQRAAKSSQEQPRGRFVYHTKLDGKQNVPLAAWLIAALASETA
jgi:hypothetical protein